MHRLALVIVALAACGGSPTPQPAPVANTTPTTTPAPAPAPAPAGQTGIAGCDALIAAYEKLAVCDKLPQQSRDAMAQGLATMKTGWGDLRTADEATRKAVDDGCRAGLDGVQQAMTAAGC